MLSRSRKELPCQPMVQYSPSRRSSAATLPVGTLAGAETGVVVAAHGGGEQAEMVGDHPEAAPGEAAAPHHLPVVGREPLVQGRGAGGVAEPVGDHGGGGEGDDVGDVMG